jgi:GT2 family glycosyltransferase
MINIAVLLTCHNRKQKTLNCLKLLFMQRGLGHEYSIQVYLVDDGSTDGTGLAVKEEYPIVKVIMGNGNLFWNRGMHTAWANAAEQNQNIDYYLWLNDDTEIYENAILSLLSAANLTSGQSIICGCIESPSKKGKLTYGGGNMHGNKRIMNYPADGILACDIIHGNCVLIPKVVYNKVGNLDWKFTHAIGDHDYSLRAKKVGVLSYTTSEFVAACEYNEGSPKWRQPKVKFIDRIKNLYSPLSYSPPNEFFIYEKRHFGLLTALKHFLSIHLRLIIPGILNNKQVSINKILTEANQ